MKYRTVKIGNVKIGDGQPVALIAGPCVIESAESAYRHAKKISEIAGKNGVPFIFKASYDKANRSSVSSFRGPGLREGIRILDWIGEELGVPVLSDVHAPDEIVPASKVLDVIQIPAFLCRQTDLLVKAGKTGKPINIKKGQFMSPWEMRNAVEKIESTGNRNIMLTERGTTFGYNYLVNDFRSILIMKRLGYPVVFDASHSVQKPGWRGVSSGGEAEFILPLAKAAVACGSDAVFIEVHEDPKKAKSDGQNMVKLSELDAFLKELRAVEKAVRR